MMDFSSGVSKDVPSWRILTATVVKDLRILKRYTANLVGGVFEVALMSFSFFIFAKVVSFRQGDFLTSSVPNSMFIFFLAGLLIMFFINTAFFMPVNTIRRDLYNGTFEYLFSDPSSKYAYLLGTIIADTIMRLIFFLPLLILLLSIAHIGTNIYPILGVISILFFLVAGLGILFSLLAVMWKEVGSLVQILGTVVQFFGGFFLPIQSFPVALQWFSYLLPFTFAIDLVRFYSFNGAWQPLLPIALQWMILVGSTIFYFILGKFLLRKTERFAKKQGLHLL